jgi:hypothetical protein
MLFPVICSACNSPSGRRVIPESPEVDTFRCGACAHEWSEPVSPPVSHAPERTLPKDWFRLPTRT